MSIVTYPTPAASGEDSTKPQACPRVLRWLSSCPISFARRDAQTVGETVPPSDVLEAARMVALSDFGNWLLWAKLDHLAPLAHTRSRFIQGKTFAVLMRYVSSPDGVEVAP